MHLWVMALKSILSNKTRAFLTMLGIIIGVGAVITMVSLVNGTTSQITENLESMGTNMISVNLMGRGSTRSISVDQMIEFGDKNTDVIAGVAPVVSGIVSAKCGNLSVDETNVIGTNEVYSTVKNTNVSDGRFLADSDVKERKKVAVIGQYIANELFNGVNPLGKEIKLNGQSFKVVGVQELKSSEASQGSSDDVVIIPYTTATRFLQDSRVRSFYVQGASSDTIEAAMNKLEAFLDEIYGSDDFYRVFNQADMLDTIKETTGSMSLMLGGIAGISLLVGGIGIMNIMLVSVTERTKEIGIRKAIGAKRRDILLQFLIEAIVLSSLGGIIGIVLGNVLSGALGKILNISSLVSILSIIVSFSFSLCIGVFFGYYPAAKASKLHPIEALRTE